jgi:hypothetical protein
VKLSGIDGNVSRTALSIPFEYYKKKNEENRKKIKSVKCNIHVEKAFHHLHLLVDS